MAHLPPPLARLARQLAKLPGIGEKSGERLAMHILRAPEKEARALAEAILEVKATVRFCPVCFALSDKGACALCQDPARATGVLCVVEEPQDLAAIEKSGAFQGRYHVLQGALSPMSGTGPDDIRVKELAARVAAGGVREVIIATGSTVEGEATASYIQSVLAPFPVIVTRIASGVPIGADLAYTDALTLRRALDGRRGM
jgi:recombination protein RecR